MVLLSGLAVTAAMVEGYLATEMARKAAIGTGAAVAASLLFDFQRGWRNLLRADVMALCALYFLTFFEFFFEQDRFDTMVSPQAAVPGIYAVLWGFAGLAVGRHLLALRNTPFWDVFNRPVSPNLMLLVFVGSFLIGYLHMFIAVNWDPMQVWYYWLEPRFAQPWGRGRLGDWKALLYELGMMIYLIPPLAGVVFARKSKYSAFQLWLVGAGLLITLFYGFSSGTRNIFASYLVTFVIGFIFAAPKLSTRNLFLMGGFAVVMLLVSTRVMLEFRNIGLRNYIKKGQYEELSLQDSLFVDYNLYVICHLVHLFPDRYNYLGWEIPYQAVIRPIPRALWKGKPDGMSLTIEEAVGVEGLTLATTFVGEAHMAFGTFGIFAFGMLFGLFAGWWSHLASPRNSDFGVLIYASGFFAIVISMRSLLVFTTAILPTMAAIVAGTVLIDKVRKRRAALAAYKQVQKQALAEPKNQ